MPVTVADFSDVVEFGFTITWDENALDFQNIQNINPALAPFGTISQFPGPGLEGINTIATAAGALTSFWQLWEEPETCEDLPAGLDLTDGAILFEICFEVTGAGGYGALNEVCFFNAPQPSLINKKLGNGTCTEDAVLGTECGSITEEVNPLVLTTVVPTGNFQPGDLVCVDIVAESGFANMQGLQFGLDWDRTVLQIESVIPNENIPNNSAFIYNVDVANNCVGTSWSYTLDDTGITLADGTVFVSACFRIIGDCGDQTNIEVSPSCNGAQIEATNSTIQTLAVVTNPDRLRINNCNNFGLDVVVDCGGPVNVGDNICIDVLAGDNYVAVNSYNYLLRFDENILSFTNTQGYLPASAISGISDFDEANVANGILGIDINHTPFGPITADPNDVIFQACFDVIGYAPNTPITISDPSSVNESNPNLILIGVDADNCEVAINQPSQVIMSFGDVDASSTNEACFTVNVSNFVDITDISFTLQYDVAGGANFTFTSLNNEALPGATLTNLGSGLLLYTYSGPPQTIPDGGLLFDVCILAQDDAIPSSCSPIDLVPIPLSPSAMSQDGTINGIVRNPGEACVLFPEGFGVIIGSATTGISSTVCVPVQVVSFDNITSGTFDITFDPTLLEYQGIALTGNWPGLVLADIDESNAAIGILTLDWTSATGPVAIPDSAIVFELCMNALETPGCVDIDGSSDAQPSATTSAGDGSILFTDGEICVENRIIITDVVVIEAPCEGVCDAQLVITAITGGENPSDVFVRLQNPFSTVFSGDTLNNVCPGWNYYTVFTADGDLVGMDSVFVDFDATQAASANAGMDRELSCAPNSCALIAGNGNVGDTYILYRLMGNVLSQETNGNIVNGSFTYCVSSGGTFVLEVMNSSGCTDQDTVIVSDPIIPVAQAGPPTATLTCDNPTLTLDGAGSSVDGIVNYLWERIIGGTIVDTISNVLPATIDSAGRYRLTVTFPQSQCVTTDEIIVMDMRIPPNVNISDTFTLACDGSPAVMDAGPAQLNYTYVWENMAGTIVSVTPDYTTSSLETYTLTVSDTTTGCETVTMIEVIESQGDPIVQNTTDQNLNCNSDTIRLTPTYANVSGNQTYQWTTVDGAFVIGEADDPDPLVIGEGTYVVTVNDGGCFTVDSIVVVPPVFPIASAGDDINLLCGQSVTIDGSNSQSVDAAYLWFTQGDTINGETNNMLTVAQPGLYVIEVRDINTQCRTTDTVEVLPPLGFPTAMLPDTLFGLTCAAGSLTVTPNVDAGGDPFTLSINGPGGPQVDPGDPTSVLVFEPGNYVLSVANDANGCSADFPFVVDGSDVILPFAAVNTGLQTITCQDPTVTISAILSSSGPNITYMWNNVVNGEVPGAQFQGTDTLVVSTAGVYELTVINTETMCESRDSVLVQDGRSFPVVNQVAFDPLTCDDLTTTLSVDIADTSGLFIQWFGPPMGTPPSSLIATNVTSIDIEGPGNYVIVTVDNASSCIVQTSYNVMLDDGGIFDIQFEPVDTFDCASDAVTIDASASLDNTNGVDISWTSLNGNSITPANGSLIVAVDGPGSYVLTLGFGAECTNSDTIFVEAGTDTPFADAGADLEIECGEMPMLEAQNSTPPSADTFLYNWTALGVGSLVSGQDGPNPIVTGVGVYALTITNLINLCESTDTVEVTLIGQEPAQLPFDFVNCSDSTSVTGNQPAGTFGTWELIQAGGATVNFLDDQAVITGLEDAVTLVWTLSATGCENYSSDTITVSRALAPVAVNDNFSIIGNNGVGTIDLLDNDQLNGPVTVELLDSVPFGEIISFFNGELTYDAGQGASGSFELRYEICSESCGTCSGGVVQVRIDADGDRPPVYNAITPNGDRLNEFLVFDLLEFAPDEYPDNNIIIFNRWGDILYEAAPYNNDWDGRNQSGNELPEGTYYYILRLSLGEGDIIRGDVTILR